MIGPTPAQLRGEVDGRCLVMGVVNVTPDSFSDGGRYFDAGCAVEHGLALAEQGADLVDVGGESTRPGAARVDEEEELRRVPPVVRELAGRGLRVSVDTMRASVAERALEAGAMILNDVSGGLADPRLPQIAARTGAVYVAMHWRGHSNRMDDLADYREPGGVSAAVLRELGQRVEALLASGIEEDAIVLDPGLGFSKDAGHNWQVLGHLGELIGFGYPVLVGTSRKRFLGTLLAGEDGVPVAPDERDAATAATSALAAYLGAWCVRVHDVPATADAVRVARAWEGGRGGA